MLPFRDKDVVLPNNYEVVAQCAVECYKEIQEGFCLCGRVQSLYG